MHSQDFAADKFQQAALLADKLLNFKGNELTIQIKLGIILKSGYSYPELAEGQAQRSPATITCTTKVNGANLQGEYSS